MKIIKAVLDGYEHLFLNEINKLEYTPHTKIQVILGTNGSGKSSLLKQLLPDAADLKEFQQGGSIYLELEHRGSLYKLTSGVRGTKKYSFIKDDIELNDGGTKKVQKYLCMEYLGINTKIKNILLSKTLFTNMSYTERKHWFTEMSNYDYTYALRLYNDLKSRIRDLKGGVRVVKEEIIKDQSKLMLANDMEVLTNEKNNLLVLQEELLKNTNRVDTTDTQHKEIENIIIKYNQIIRNILSKYIDIDTNYNIRNIEYIKNNLEVELVHINNNIKKLEKEIDELDVVEITDVYIEKDKLNKIKSEITELERLSKDTIDIDLNEAYIHRKRLDSIENDFLHITRELTDLYNNIDTDKSFKELLVIKDKLNSSMVSINKKISVKNELLLRMENIDTEDNNINCPVCAHSWTRYTKEDITDTKHQLNNLKHDISKLENKHIKVMDILYKKEKILEYRKDLIGLLRTIPNLVDVLNIKSNDNPSVYISKYNNIKVILDDLSTYPRLKEEMLELENIINTKTKIDIINNKKNSERKDKLNIELEKYTADKHIHISKIDKASKDEKILTTLNNTRGYLMNAIKKHKSMIDDKVKIEINGYLQEMVAEVRRRIYEIDEKIMYHSNYKSKIDGNEILLKEYEKKVELMNIALKELSPSEGLIAENMTLSIKHIVDDMNRVINSIWTYPMEILPPELGEDVDLDYVFKVRVDNKKEVDDISSLSSSMQEIVNLAFKIVFAKNIGLGDYPLILDEFGKAFDTEHIYNAYSVIDKIMTSDYNQIFIVAHFENMYGRFKCDTSILSKNNLSLHKDIDYNKVMTFS